MNLYSVINPRCLLLNKKLVIFLICFSVLLPFHVGEATNTLLDGEKVLESINIYREKYNLENLVINEKLNNAAIARINDMQGWHYFNHTNPIGLNFSFFVKDAEYEFELAGENLARNYFDEQALFNAWKKSFYHRKIILGEKYQDVGFAFGEISYKNKTNLVAVMILGKEKPPTN